MTEFMKCCITTLSPVHIGCDEVYEPTGFVVDEKNAKLIAFDTTTFLDELSDEKLSRFSDLCKKGTVPSILEIYQFMREEQGSVTGPEVEVCSGFLNHYTNTLKLRGSGEQRILQELNRFTIARTAFLPSTGRAYIPGSAVKGAMRTAYLNLVASHKQPWKPAATPRGRDLERYLLDGGNFETDPFRMVKVSDFLPVGSVKTKIVYAVNEKKKPSGFQARGPYQILEVIEPGGVFTGTLTVEKQVKGTHSGKAIINPTDLQKLWNSVSSFYLVKEKKREDSELAAVGIPNSASSCETGSTLLRIGRHSGAESVTIEKYRKIKIMLGKGKGQKTLDHATTFWLASESDNSKSNPKELKPFGWVALMKLDSEREREFEEIDSKWRKKNEDERAKILERAQAELSRQAEERRMADIEAEQRRLEQERKQKEEDERQAALAAMTTGQKIVVELNNPHIQENRIYEIFGKIDEFDEKIAIAAAIKACWIRMKKWSKKCTPKQWSKVQKLKGILGED